MQITTPCKSREGSYSGSQREMYKKLRPVEERAHVHV